MLADNRSIGVALVPAPASRLAVRAPANSRGRPASDRDPVLRPRAGAPGVAQGRDELGRGVSCQGCTQQTLSAQKRQEHGSTSSRLASAPRAGTARARFLPRPFTCPSRRVSEVVGRSACGGPAAPPGFSRARAAARSSAPALSAWPSVARQSKIVTMVSPVGRARSTLTVRNQPLDPEGGAQLAVEDGIGHGPAQGSKPCGG